MRYYDKITPDGTRDLLFGECDQRSQVTKTLKELFVSQGYRRVMTPALEFYDVFGKAAPYLPKESMYKLTDAKGRLMVLCPDCTAPVADFLEKVLTEISIAWKIMNQIVTCSREKC